MVIINKRNSKCSSCSDDVTIGKGFAYLNGNRWQTVCASTACQRRLGVTPPPTKTTNTNRKLHDNGTIEMPFDRSALPLIKGMPKARWNPDNKVWTVSVDVKDLPRVIEVADRLNLEISDELRSKSKEGTVETRAGEKRAEEFQAPDGRKLFEFQKAGVAFLVRHDRALLADQMGLGKAQPINTPVLTPNGWVPIGKISVGDFVISKNGNPTKVTGVFPQGLKKVFEVIFNDKSSTKCCEDHLWAVQTAQDKMIKKDFKVISLKYIIKSGLKNKRNHWFIPVVDPVSFSKKELLIHPYLLGALIAKGTLKQNSICHSGDDEQRAEIAPLIPKSLSLKNVDDCTYRISGDISGKPNELIDNLRLLGLKDLLSPEKFIPKIYLLGSIEQRIALLNGLMDNDGTVSKDGMCNEYNTTSQTLAKNVVELAQSLGGIARVSTRIPKYFYKGKVKEVKEDKRDYRIRIKLPSEFCLFKIPRKKDLFVAPSRYKPVKAISSANYINEEECVCIKVEADDHLYVTENYIVTHNTVQTIAAVADDAAVIVISPACVKFNWKNEFNSWRPSFSVKVLSGKNSFEIPKPGEVVILNYDILPNYFEIIKEKDGKYPNGKIKYKYISNPNLSDEDKKALSKVTLVCDEIHTCKNYKAKRSGKVKALGSAVQKMWGLTGTPLPNRPPDLYGVFNVLNTNVFSGWNKFVSLFNGYKGRFGYEFGLPTSEVPERLRRVMIRRLKSEVLKDLPPKRYQMITVNGLDKKLGKELDIYLVKLCIRQGLIKLPKGKSEASVKFLKDNIKLAHEISPCLTKLPGFEEFSAMRSLLASSRIPAVLEMVEEYEEANQAVIIFCAHKAPVQEIAKRDGWALITGDTPAKKRTEIVEQFQAGQLKGIAATIKAAGVGLTLTYASEALFIDYDWTPANNVQAEDRLARIGQTKSVLIKSLQSNHPLDQHIQTLLQTKILWSRMALDDDTKYTEKKLDVSSNIELNEESDSSLSDRLDKLEEINKEEVRKFFLNRVQSILERERERASFPEPKLTDKRKTMIEEALDYMCSTCDGAKEKDNIGFNKPDAAIAHWLNKSGMQDEVTFRVAERILSRYHRQLGNEFEDIWVPEMEAAS